MHRTPILKAALPEHASPSSPLPHQPAKWPALRNALLASIAALVAGNLAPPAMAASGPRTKLVRCGEQSCLLISGRRADSAEVVRINGHVVAVEGNRYWRVRIPVEVVQRWSPPHARTIEVSLQGAETQRETVADAELPIGLLGGVTTLAALVISVR